MLCGCTTEDACTQQALAFRETLLSAQSCTFHSEITAHYDDYLYTFQMDCTADATGNLHFTVTDPDTIAGISGTISQEGAALTFDDKVLAFPMLADGQLTPVSAPWIFLKTLRSGYLTGCSTLDDRNWLYIDDSYEDNPLHLEIQTDDQMVPQWAEIIWKDRRILSVRITSFKIQ